MEEPCREGQYKNVCAWYAERLAAYHGGGHHAQQGKDNTHHVRIQLHRIGLLPYASRVHLKDKALDTGSQ